MTIKLQREIAEDFGQPFREVVKGFAEDGYSIGGTARILEYPETMFRRIVEGMGWAKWFREDPHSSPLARDARSVSTPARAETARKNLNKARGRQAHKITYDGVTDSMAGHARRLGLNRSTVKSRYERVGADWDYVFATEEHPNFRNSRRA